jgi:hypothetical protein
MATMSASLAQPEITTAQLLTLVVTVERDPPAASVDWDAMQVGLPEGWQVLSRQARPDEPLDSGRIKSSVTLTIEPFLPGDFEIGPISLSLDEGSEPLTAQPMSVSVRSVLPAGGEDVEVAARAGVVDPTWPTPWLLIGVCAGAIVMIAGLSVLFVMLYQSRTRVEKRTYRTPDELASEALDALLGRDLLASGLIKEHFAQVSDVVRRYIEDRFALRAPEQTTPEFLISAARSRVLTPKDVEELERFLTQCDLVKFAGFRPQADEAGGVSDAARAFIARTRSDSVRIVFDSKGKRIGREAAAPTTEGAAA